MAIRNIMIVGREGDEVLRKKSKKVEKFDARLHALIDDMIDTMKDANGAGLAAPQVGMLKRVVVIDVDGQVIEFVNPEIIKTEGEKEDREGCLSLPGQWGMVVRPEKVTVKAQDRNGEEFTLDGEELMGVAFCHEIDHLDGILYTDKATRMLSEEEIRQIFEEYDDDEDYEYDDEDEFEEQDED